MYVYAHAHVKGFLFFGLIVVRLVCSGATESLKMASMAILWIGMINHVEKKASDIPN